MFFWMCGRPTTATPETKYWEHREWGGKEGSPIVRWQNKWQLGRTRVKPTCTCAGWASPATQGGPGPQHRHEHHCQDWERQAASQTCISRGTRFLYPVRSSGNLPLGDETILCASNSPKAQGTREDLQGRSDLCPGGMDLISTLLVCSFRMCQARFWVWA